MYLRFESGVIDPDCRRAHGFFSAMFDYLYARDTPTDWLWDALWEERCWFNEHLDAPSRFRWRNGKYNGLYGVCWFKPGATECIDRARHVALLLGEAGVPVESVKAADPGQIIWADAQQVVAVAR